MKELFDEVSRQCSRITTRSYSTSFSLGISFLDKRLQAPIYGIYGFVRFADEIVDSFHDYDKASLLAEFRKDTYRAIEQRISTNPILNSFQEVVHSYGIDRGLIDAFLRSMEMDLENIDYDRQIFEEYILGSAEVVGLMCLRVFTNGDDAVYERLRAPARRLGAAFQKINFLRDIQADYHLLGRSYFPGVDLENFNSEQKAIIEREIEEDFDAALDGIRQLNRNSQLGVYLAYVYYRALYRKIRRTPHERLMNARIRISNREKVLLLLYSSIRHRVYSI